MREPDSLSKLAGRVCLYFGVLVLAAVFLLGVIAAK